MEVDLTAKSKAILEEMNKTIHSFFDIFDNLNGAAEEDSQHQDLLRAIVLFSCAGIDAIVKELIIDTLDLIIEKDEGAFVQFRSFVERQMGKNDNANIKLISKLFTCSNPRKEMIQNLKRELTSNSLQSSEELFKVASYFNIPTLDLGIKQEKLKEIFAIRNQISHEMDIEFSSEEIGKRVRERSVIQSYAEELLKLGDKFITLVEKKLNINH